MKVMAHGMAGGTSFMEDYTYDFDGTPKILGSHMLEICPTIAAGKPSLEVHPLGIGGKADPVRLVFTAPARPRQSWPRVVDMGDRFRMIVNEVDVIRLSSSLPSFPLRAPSGCPRPALKVGAAAWIYAGGAHHTGFSQALTTEHLEDFAEIAGIELIVIDEETRLREFRRQLLWEQTAHAGGRRR